MGMDPAIREQLRATDTTEKQTARKRRYRARLKAKTNNPVDIPRGQMAGLVPADSSERPNVHGPVICGHCGVLYPDASTGALHVVECPVRDKQTAQIKKSGECCMCKGKEWWETPCGCFCHYPNVPAWTMTKGGHNLPPHKHRDDENGRCVQCGAERG